MTFGDGSSTTWIDPVVTIDPVCMSHNPAYSIAFSNGNQNVGVPEPSTWALMLVGFGAAATALRRRNAAAKPIA